MNDEATSFYTRNDWSRLGQGLLTQAEEEEILAEGYENILDINED